MEVYRRLKDLRDLPGPLSFAIGVFDGVHVGHREVIESALHDSVKGGTTVVLSFDPHPMQVLAPAKAPRLLTSSHHKERLIAGLGVEHYCVLTFDEQLAGLVARDFLKLLIGSTSSGICSMWVGEEWLFGKGATGDVALMREVGESEGFAVGAVPAVLFKGERVSSTRVRHAVQLGNFELARNLLGRDYTVRDTVIEGKKLGRELGFPTANLKVHNEQLPPSGVYAVEVEVGTQVLYGVGNLGLRPTVDRDEVKRMLEVHLFDFDDDLYSKELEVKFLHYLREEKKFEGVEALQAQITCDVQLAKEKMKLL